MSEIDVLSHQNLKIFPGLRPWPPWGGLQTPRPPAVKRRHFVPSATSFARRVLATLAFSPYQLHIPCGVPENSQRADESRGTGQQKLFCMPADNLSPYQFVNRQFVNGQFVNRQFYKTTIFKPTIFKPRQFTKTTI